MLSYEDDIAPEIERLEKNVNILIVEDDPDDYKAIFRLLSKVDGYSVRATRAPSAFAARSSLSESYYDVVIADYRLGRETGIDVIMSIARQRPDIGPILVSRCLSPEVHEAALSAGAVHCIDKDELTAMALENAIHAATRKVLQRYVLGVFKDYAEDDPYRVAADEIL
jgi:DNA-binding NarL/FixJ family response regulator